MTGGPHILPDTSLALWHSLLFTNTVQNLTHKDRAGLSLPSSIRPVLLITSVYLCGDALGYATLLFPCDKQVIDKSIKSTINGNNNYLARVLHLVHLHPNIQFVQTSRCHEVALTSPTHIFLRETVVVVVVFYLFYRHLAKIIIDDG